jgi:phosphonate transport system ATP-binding protein
MTVAVEVERLSKSFVGRKALDAVSLSVKPGEMVALIGASGSGKSTLLRHMAGLLPGDRDSQGAIRIGGDLIQQHGRIARDIRRRRAGIGFIFQQFNLVGRLCVETNVLVGLLSRMPVWRSLTGWFSPEERVLAQQALARVGIAEHAARRASTLSGGQQQRAAIARALVQRAGIILADEPIASLDPESSRKVMETLADINRRDGITVIVSLHQVDIARRYCPRAVALKDGVVAFDGPATALTDERLRQIYGSEADQLHEPPGVANEAPPRRWPAGVLAASA